MSSTIRQSTKLITLVIVISILVSFNTDKAYSAGQYAPKTKTPTPTLTRTNTPSPTVTNTATPTGTAFTCTTWNIANDFRISPNQENPNRDSCNTLGVWEFMGSSSLTRDPGTYYRVTTFSPATGGYAGLDFWLGNYTDSNGSFPDIGFNGSGADILIAGHISLPANALDIHPAPNQLGIVAWHSPVTGYVSITGGVGDNDGACGDGIFWYLEKNSVNLAYGAIGNGGSQLFSAGTGGMGLNTVSVNTGDAIYLAIHPNGDYVCDNTRVDLGISVTSPPTATATHTATPTITSTITNTPTITWTPSNTPTAVTYTPIAGTPQSNGSGPCWISGGSWTSYTAYFDIVLDGPSAIPSEWVTVIHDAKDAWNNVVPSQFQLVRQLGSANQILYQQPINHQNG